LPLAHGANGGAFPWNAGWERTPDGGGASYQPRGKHPAIPLDGKRFITAKSNVQK